MKTLQTIELKLLKVIWIYSLPKPKVLKGSTLHRYYIQINRSVCYDRTYLDVLENLSSKGYIRVYTKDNNHRYIRITAKGIDEIEKGLDDVPYYCGIALNSLCDSRIVKIKNRLKRILRTQAYEHPSTSYIVSKIEEINMYRQIKRTQLKRFITTVVVSILILTVLYLMTKSWRIHHQVLLGSVFYLNKVFTL
ncbi:hypothetical protein [Spirochaeta cellobiosiphila]|uniref:hypothetical protein n=1 Tax=Spirochaeta cellobiosiphila TaxID=504483 RepID=UPI0003FA9054|nr:hypothetical protein [Spirochaeta cellobiosiphila]